MKAKHIEAILDFKRVESEKRMKLAELQASCDHKKEKKGKQVTALKQVGDSPYEFVCSICGESVNLNPIDLADVREAATLIKNVLESIKVAEDDLDSEILKQFGVTKLILERIPEAYKDLVVEKMEDNDFNDSDSFNTYQNMGIMNPMMAGFVANPAFMAQMAGQGGYGKKHKNKNKKNKKKNHFKY